MATYMKTPHVAIWVRPEPFLLGVLPAAPHLKLSTKFLKMLLPYSKTKGIHGYPKMSYLIWKHIACNKLQLPETMAWMYFDIYKTMQRKLCVDEQIQWDIDFGQCTGAAEKDNLKNMTMVDTTRFVLLLFLQQFNKISFRSGSYSSMPNLEQWPNPLSERFTNPDRDSSRRSLKVFLESRHMTFISNKLAEILELFGDDKAGSRVKGQGFNVSIKTVEALSFLIEGSLDNFKSVIPLHEILLSKSVRQEVGFTTSPNGFDSLVLISWIDKYICLYPFGSSSFLSLNKEVQLRGSSENYSEKLLTKKGTMFANVNSGLPGHKFLVLSRFNKQTVAKSSSSLKDISVRIHHCHESYIYLLVPLRSVVITKCRKTTIVLGPVSTTVVMSVCYDMRLITVCRRLTISDCLRCTFYLMTPSHPLFIGRNNFALTLAPFNTMYAKLEEHMYRAGISDAINLWDDPLCLSDEGNIETRNIWNILPSQDFYIFNIPFEMEGNTKRIPGTPLLDYQTSLKYKKRQVKLWHHLVKNANLDQQQRMELNKIVRARFQMWLIFASHQGELDGLVINADGRESLKRS